MSLIHISVITVNAIDDNAIAGDLVPTETPKLMACFLKTSTYFASSSTGSGDIKLAIGNSASAKTFLERTRHNPSSP